MPTTSCKEPTKESQDTKPSVVKWGCEEPLLIYLVLPPPTKARALVEAGCARLRAGRARLRGRARTPARKGGAHVCGGRACMPARWGVHVYKGCAPMWGGRASLRGARTSIWGRARMRGGRRVRLRGGRAWSFLSFGSSAAHFQIKLSIHASNFNSKFVSMGELELFLLTGVLTPNFSTMDLVKILERNQKLHIQIVAVTLKVTSCRTMSKKKK
jgi:hypothetical protein